MAWVCNLLNPTGGSTQCAATCWIQQIGCLFYCIFIGGREAPTYKYSPKLTNCLFETRVARRFSELFWGGSQVAGRTLEPGNYFQRGRRSQVAPSSLGIIFKRSQVAPSFLFSFLRPSENQLKMNGF